MLDFRSLIVFSCGSLGAFAPQPSKPAMKKGCCKAKASAVSKNVLETMFVHIERIEYAKTYSSYPKFIGTHGKNPIQKAQQLRVTNSFSKINAWMPYIQSTTAHVCNYIWGCSGHAEGTCWMDFKGLTQSSPARNSSASALASASLERLSAWNDDWRKWSNDEWIISINIR